MTRLLTSVLVMAACGAGAERSPPVSVSPPPSVPAPSAAAIDQLVLSRAGSCGVFSNGTARCWGAWDSQLMNVSVPAASLSNLHELRVGHDQLERPGQRYIDHFCVRDTQDEVQCWGNGHQGQLGADGGDNSPTPVAVRGLPAALQLALGSDHACATTAAGDVRCWGSNEFGQLGIGKGIAKLVRPAAVAIPGKVAQLVASDMDTCALTTDHEVYCWGENIRGEAGASNMALQFAWTPNHVAIASHSRQLSAAYSTLCAVKESGHIACWGYLTSQLGPDFAKSTSGEVPGIDDAIEVAVGYAHACALRRDGTVSCWGNGDVGQLGNGRTDGSRTPAPVGLSGRATSVVTGMRNTCARLEDRRWFCWGENRYGQIGPRSQPLIATPTLLDLSQVDLASQ